MRRKKMVCFLLALLLVSTIGCSIQNGDVYDRAEQKDIVNVIYETISPDWPMYKSATELVDACDRVVLGTVTDISFQVLDIRTGKVPEDNIDDLYCYLYTIYDIDIVETYKGDQRSHEQVRIIGGLEDIQIDEQIEALGQNPVTIFILEDMVDISKGETYLFMLAQFDDSLPTIANVEQSIYNISEALSNETSQSGAITIQEIVKCFGANEWKNMYNIAQELIS